ncbi:hypothetical protein D307_gp234 [Bacillus phage Bastille]|uniref:Uncharacterized protein n=3 Tax=Bastillevirus TaxID=1918010 RepID=A0A024AZP5_9CAUD|nr:hypothetical protein D307_gp234 [Bacillus phage Bastille]YP_009035294.1 hypothetical protein FP73_gp244 [Bacillus phage Hoody T]YP_009035621.1 hypothetical protein FP76_gp270 [Bacillus phage Evoli]ASR79871.1 hypothetical protein JANET_107 [Bacillus phage Janet]AEQ34230.1 hypothetical protein [Bacillus phage Bastille]AHZ09824.1 hypothetical protein [Bacillus phage Evoli]AHZ10409.1 hypothetical protein [Bacillus phage Hoody T]
MNLPEQQGQPIDPNFLLEEQGELINRLTHENLSLRAYIKQVLADNQLMMEKLNEAVKQLEPEDEPEES